MRTLGPGRTFKRFSGDAGSGGAVGLVPAPAAGDGAAHKFLRADGAFALPDYSPVRPQAYVARSTVMTGPMASGAPSFLPTTSGVLSITTQNIAAGTPLIATASAGWDVNGAVDVVGKATSNFSWTGLAANATVFLPVEIVSGGVTPKTTTALVPIQKMSGAASTASGQYTFIVSEMQMYLGNGTTASKVNHVIVGEVVTNGSGVVSTIAYAYNGLVDSGFTSTLWSIGSTKSFAHNIGSECTIDAFLRCDVADGGFAVGDTLHLSCALVDYYSPVTFVYGRNSVSIATMGSNGWIAVKKDSATTVALTLASWSYKFVARRNW
ncbi:MAG: hypothetical protein KDK08_05815 [Rhizobiaceae bacterium]|nr:hypothetical protein [Rhizobiaceae bacterium]MCC0000977.1 hypothetical protein [Methylobacteriaceae bacterium]